MEKSDCIAEGKNIDKKREVEEKEVGFGVLGDWGTGRGMSRTPKKARRMQ
jgi:hypothetical protein